MKVEIELWELEQLKSRMEMAEKNQKELELKWRSVDVEVLRRNAIETVEQVFEEICKLAFIELGFKDTDYAVKGMSIMGLEFKIIDGRWQSTRKMDVKLGAEIMGGFRKAFLNIGIVAKED